MNVLDAVFGSDSTGETEAARAPTSTRRFVRSQTQLGFWTEGARGRVLTPTEALESFGMEKLVETLDYGSALLRETADEPAATLLARREALGLSREALARVTALSAEAVKDSEDPTTHTPIRTLEPLAIALGLDERLLGVKRGADGDDRLAARLKILGTSRVRGFSEQTTATFAEGGLGHHDPTPAAAAPPRCSVRALPHRDTVLTACFGRNQVAHVGPHGARVSTRHQERLEACRAAEGASGALGVRP